LRCLASGGPVSPATDIGYQSVNGNTAGSSSLGYAFDAGSDFALAIDFAVSFGSNPSGTLGIGFGIGEGINGADSAGMALLLNNANPLAWRCRSGWRCQPDWLLPIRIRATSSIGRGRGIGDSRMRWRERPVRGLRSLTK
jgi:hypothetical protein